MEKHITIRSGEHALVATLHYPRTNADVAVQKYPVALFVHGFVGNRIGENRLFVRAAREFAEQGYLVLRFDLIGCGESQGDYGQTGLESFVTQTRDVIDYLYGLDLIDPDRFTLIGHSLGGATAVLTAARDKRIKQLALWAPVGHPFSDILKLIGNDTFERIQKDGQASYLGYGLTRSFMESLTYLHPFQEAIKFAGDVMLVHGTADAEIPVDYTYLYDKLFWSRTDGTSEKHILLGADHRFTNTADAEHTIALTLNWLAQVEQRRKDWFGWTI